MAAVNCDVLSSVSFVCPTQNGKQNNLLQPLSLQSLLSHTTLFHMSYFLKYIMSATYLLSGKRTKKGRSTELVCNFWAQNIKI